MHPFLLNKRIDLVDFEHFKLLMFRDDNLYNLTVSDDRKNQSLREHYHSIATAGGYPSGPITPDNERTVNAARYCLQLTLIHLWNEGLPTTVLDIGAFVGDFSIQMGALARTFRRPTRVHAFDPTEAGALVPYNIALNGLEAYVQHWPLAISDYAGLMLFTVTPGMSDAAHTGSKGSTRFNPLALARQFLRTQHKANYIKKVAQLFRIDRPYNLITRGVKISEWLAAERIDSSIFCKIDIEGADMVVLRDLREAVKNNHLVCTFEFCPANFESKQASAAWLSDLCTDFALFDIWYSPRPAFCRRIESEQLGSFVEEISRERPFGYTDVMIVPHQLPGADRLTQRLAGLTPGRREYLF